MYASLPRSLAPGTTMEQVNGAHKWGFQSILIPISSRRFARGSRKKI
jgi:hypothetical protein